MKMLENEAAFTSSFGEPKQQKKEEINFKPGDKLNQEELKRDIRHWESQMNGRPPRNRNNSMGSDYHGPCRIIG